MIFSKVIAIIYLETAKKDLYQTLTRLVMKSPFISLKLFDCLSQCFSTARTRPGTGTYRPSYRDLNYFWIFKSSKIINEFEINYWTFFDFNKYFK